MCDLPKAKGTVSRDILGGLQSHLGPEWTMDEAGGFGLAGARTVRRSGDPTPSVTPTLGILATSASITTGPALHPGWEEEHLAGTKC